MNDGRASRESRWWEGDAADADDPVVGATALLVLGAGLGSLFGVPLLSAVDFWIVFVIGYAVIVPLVSLLRGRNGEREDRTTRAENPAPETRSDEKRREDSDVDAALARLRDRYARGDLSEAQFERKLEVLLETDTPENARERAERIEARAERDDRARTAGRDDHEEQTERTT